MKNMIKRIIPQQSRTRMLRILKRIQSLKKKENFFAEHYDIEEKNSDAFFGYYDINPFHKNYIIYNTTNKNGTLNIHIREGSKEERILGETHAWCWQQGCRLRWLRNTDDYVCWNDYSDGQYCCVIYDLCHNKKRYVSWALYDIDRTGQKGLSLNFVRLGYMRPGYGYTNEPFVEVFDPNEEGIYYVDLQDNMAEMILTYKEIGQCLGKDFDYKDYYINHLSFNPSGTKFLFFFIKKGMIHQATLFVFDIEGRRLTKVEDELSVSHYCWIDDSSMMITAYDKKRECRYYIYGSDLSRRSFMPNLLKVDGHPTWVNEEFMITDTYPDNAGFQKLLLVNPIKQTVNVLADIYTSEKRMGEQRTDLHPRIDSASSQICIDSNVNGFRKLTILKVNQDGKTK